jgi:calcium/calmodulin-dependent protein kinase I
MGNSLGCMSSGTKQTRNEDIAKYYDIKDKLGAGSFATVKRGVRKTDGAEFAIKVVKKTNISDEELAVVYDEVRIMRQITHDHCVRLFEIYETPKRIYMVMELLTGGELFDRIVNKGSFSEREASELTRDLMSAIHYLHSINIVHRDLKPENLIYQSNSSTAPVKITDFGLAKNRKGQSKMTTACGTPGYVAPEILKNEPYTRQVDLWSIGVILYILLCGFPPFYHDQTAKLYEQIKRGDYSFPSPYWDEISPEAKDLVRGLLTVDPAKRMTSDQVLKHPWIADGIANDRAFGQDHLDRIKLLQAKRKLRRAVQVIIAVNRFNRIFNALADDRVKVPPRRPRVAPREPKYDPALARVQLPPVGEPIPSRPVQAAESPRYGHYSTGLPHSVPI